MSVRGVLLGEPDLGGVAIFRFVGLELLSAIARWEGEDAALDDDLGNIRYILLVSGSVRTEMGEVWDGSRSGQDRADACGVVGGVPSSETGAA